MKRLFLIAVLLFTACLTAKAQITFQVPIPTTSNPPTVCTAGQLYSNSTLNPAKLWEGNSVGGCTEVDALAALASPTFTGQVLIPTGTPSAPGIGMTAQTNTGINFVAANNLAVYTGGIVRMQWDGAGDTFLNTIIMDFANQDAGLTRSAVNTLKVTNGSTGYGITDAKDYLVNGLTRSYFVTSDFTTAANTNFQLITGLAWTVPVTTAMNIPFECHLSYSQATAVVAVSFGIQDVTVAPTQINATGNMQTAATTFTGGVLNALASTTATAIVTATPSVITTVWTTDLYGFIEQPSNASTSAIQIQVKTSTAGDAITVKRGSFCRIN